MIAVLVVLALGAAIWMWVMPSERFLTEFAALLSEPTVTNDDVLSGRQSATGRFEGRDVTIDLQLPRGDYQRGFLVVALRTTGPQTLDNEGIESRAIGDEAQRALFTIAANDLVVRVEEGWLKAEWTATELFRTFPGPYSEEKWRKVLNALEVVAKALDGERCF